MWGESHAEGTGPGRARAEGAGLVSGGGLHEQLEVRGMREDGEEVEPREEYGEGENWGRSVLAGGGFRRGGGERGRREGVGTGAWPGRHVTRTLLAYAEVPGPPKPVAYKGMIPVWAPKGPLRGLLPDNQCILTVPGAHFKTENQCIRYPANKYIFGEEIMY